MDSSLSRHYPVLAKRAPRVCFTNLPTPVRRLAGIGAEIGRDDLWIKCDDRTASLYGGNKPRKLEYLLGDALARGRRCVLTTGGTGTHHGLATAIFARHVGLRCILVLLDQPLTEHVRRSLLLDLAAGAEIHYAASVAGVAARGARIVARETLRGAPPYIVATGGSSAVGTLGYVDAALELAEQIRGGELPEPARVYVATGSAGTAAGLSLGFQLAGLGTQVIGVSVSDLLPPTANKIAGLARRCLRHMRRLDPVVPALDVAVERVRVQTEFVGPGYGAVTAEGRRAMARIRNADAIGLEATYTAKCLAALLADAERGDLPKGPVLFWNTYSSIDPAQHLGPLPDYHALPPALHRLFTDPLPEGV